MKPNLLVLACVAALVLVAAVPGLVARAPSAEAPKAPVPGLRGNLESSVPCRLAVEIGPRTSVDRGTLAPLRDGLIPAASFRYWQEPAGPVLYVYDDVQDLVGRVVNPVRVRVVGETPAE